MKTIKVFFQYNGWFGVVSVLAVLVSFSLIPAHLISVRLGKPSSLLDSTSEAFRKFTGISLPGEYAIAILAIVSVLCFFASLSYARRQALIDSAMTQRYQEIVQGKIAEREEGRQALFDSWRKEREERRSRLVDKGITPSDKGNDR